MRLSNIADGIFRTYYARPLRDSISIPPGSSGANTASRSQSRVSRPDGALGVFRPRTRQREDDTAPPTRDSMAITPVLITGDTPVEIRGPARRKVTEEWSPHLWPDRRAWARRSIFKAPSIDEEAEGSGVSRRSVQILLFAGGFLFPLGKLPYGSISWLDMPDKRDLSVDRRLFPTTPSHADAPRRGHCDAESLQSRTGSGEGDNHCRRGAPRECSVVAEYQSHHVGPRTACHWRCSKLRCFSMSELALSSNILQIALAMVAVRMRS